MLLQRHLQLIRKNSHYKSAVYSTEAQAANWCDVVRFLLTLSPRLELSSCFCTKGSFQLDLAGNLRGDDLQGADAFGRSALLSEWSRPRVDEVSSRSSGTASTKGFSHNVREFTHSVISSWMSTWRSRPVRKRSVAWCIQETHVSDFEEAQALSLQWATLWGKPRAIDHLPLSY